MYSHSAKKRAADRKKTQEELRVFENLNVESENEKEKILSIPLTKIPNALKGEILATLNEK